MASATARPTFSFHRLPTPHHAKPSKPHLPFPFLNSKLPTISSSSSSRTSILPSSSLGDKPLLEPTKQEVDQEQVEQKELLQENVEKDEVKFDSRRPEEKFAVLNTGIHECRSCGYLYDEAAGDPAYPIPPGMQFGQLPEDWRCPTCGAAKSFFRSKSVEIAGFAENQQFGLGANTLTSGQKALLIYGSLLFFFLLFLSGYFLQ